MSVSLETKQQTQGLSGVIQQQPSNEADRSYHNGELTLQVDAQTKTVKITWEKIKIGAKASKKWTITGLVLGFLGGFAVGRLSTGAIFGLLGGVIGLSARTVVYICKVNELESKVDEMRIIAGKICGLVHDLEKKQRIQGVVTEALRYLRNIIFSNPDILDGILSKENRPNLSNEADRLPPMIEKHIASWNDQIEMMYWSIIHSLQQKRDKNQISIEEYIEETSKAFWWYRDSLIK